MKLVKLGLVLSVVVTLAGCVSQSPGSDPFGQYNRQTVCANLTRQLQFAQDQGYNATNQGAAQIQNQRLLASYKANGCDK